MTNLKETILKKIHEHEVIMRPRWPFMLRGIFLLLLTSIIICFVLFVIVIITVSLRANGLIQLSTFGIPGFFHFFINLPWLIIFGIFIALIIVEILFRKFSFGYRTPALITLGIVGIVTILGGIFLSSIGPKIMTEKIRNNSFIRFEMMGESPEFIKRRPLTFGVIKEIGTSDIIVETDKEVIRVFFDESTRFPDGKKILFVGSSVFVGGLRTGNTMHAFGISDEPPELRFYRRQMMLKK